MVSWAQRPSSPGLTHNQVRTITDDDIGLKVLYQRSANAADTIECVRLDIAQAYKVDI